MPIIEIRDPKSGSFARIAPELGFNCFRFDAVLSSGKTASVLNAPDDFPNGLYPIGRYGNPILFPYPNRIAAGRFSWDHKEYQLRDDQVLFDETGHAIHGLCIDRPWRISSLSESSVTGVFRLSIDAPERRECWPADAEIQVRYEVHGTSLRSQIVVFNPDNKPLPWGFGTHAYFNVPFFNSSSKNDCWIQIPSKSTLTLRDCLPTGEVIQLEEPDSLREGRCLEGLKADDVYTSLIPEDDAIACRLVDNPANVQFEQRCSRDFREVIVFTPWWSSSVCMEPYTCMTNAINLQQQGVNAGLRVLNPGEHWTGFIDLSVGKVVKPTTAATVDSLQ